MAETAPPTTRPPLLQPPRLRSAEQGGVRRASWLELFYDLVFVVIVAELAHTLEGDISWRGVGGFAALFVPVWWAWVGTTFYSDRFDTDDLVHRLAIGAQMVAAGSMAINIHDGLGETAVGFALSYAAMRGILVLLYLGARVFVPEARALTTHYAIGFALAAAVWGISAFVPPPVRFVLWGLGLLVDFGTPLSAVRLQMRTPIDASHIPERFGLFVIIVLGEAVVSVVQGSAEVAWRLASAGTAALGFAIALSLWWIYFDNLNETAVRRLRVAGQIWLYAHLPLVLSVVAAGVDVERLILAAPGAGLAAADRWLLCGAVALGLAAMAAIHPSSLTTAAALRCEMRARYRLGGAAAALALGAIGAGLAPVAVAGGLATIVAAQVVADALGKDERTHADAQPGQDDRLPSGASAATTGGGRGVSLEATGTTTGG